MEGPDSHDPHTCRNADSGKPDHGRKTPSVRRDQRIVVGDRVRLGLIPTVLPAHHTALEKGASVSDSNMGVGA